MEELFSELELNNYREENSNNYYPYDLDFIDRDGKTKIDDIRNYSNIIIKSYIEKPKNPFHYIDEKALEEIDDEDNWESNKEGTLLDPAIESILMSPVDMSSIPEIPEYHQDSPLANISDINSLLKAFAKCKDGVEWKASIQRFEASVLLYTTRLQRDIDLSINEDTPYRYDPPYEFKLNERGHIRDIKAQTPRDRVMQASLNYNILLPKILPKLIYDNGASQKGKGLSFTKRRFENHLREAYAQFGPEAIIVLIDFSKYFDNIRHQVALNMFRPYLTEAEYNFLALYFNHSQVDVSYMNDDEYNTCMDNIFNSLDYAENISKDLQTGKKFMPKSVGIGSQTSQITGVFYPHYIDNYCKIVRGLKYYGRYMDDTYFIVQIREEAQYILFNIWSICDDLGIFINAKKTRVLRLKDHYTFLKTNYFFRPEDGKLIRKVHSSVFHREYKKINAFHRLYLNKIMTLEDIVNCFKGWLGTYKKFDSGDKILFMKNHFLDTFKGLPVEAIKKHSCIKIQGNEIYRKTYNKNGKMELKKLNIEVL